MRRHLRMTGYLICVFLLVAVLAAAVFRPARDWRTASREPVGLAPDPAQTPEPIVQIYAARAVSWRGLFGVHKDYSGDRLFTSAPSGNGVQLSLFGLLGLTASGVEGLELNLLGLTFGVNPFDPALKLPIVGRLGPARAINGGSPVKSLPY